MPNFKVFQDNPDQMRIKIFGSNNVAFNTDASGNLSITASGLAVTGSVNVGTVSITSTGLAVTGSVNVGTVSITSTGLAVTGSVNVGTVSITTAGVPLGIAIESLSPTEAVEVVANKTSTTYSGATARTVLGYNAWTFAVKNESLDANAQAVVQIQMSATGASESDWLQEVAPVTINQNSVAFLTSSLLVKYARVYYAAVNSASAVTLNIVFQAQK
ncbi:DUF6385 domain-containing protein [Thermincola potens]|uniref:DUF6385 domain-containing protein n=1 Tax=Thermincola potens (strain JR) TaxID=635013 RepID=D5XDH1_THEPJ|nr:DUF6385 domain-containing protein [Thermincola potens]ADG81819.1 conserved hypothetical protein [Thermincola potens JR]